MDFLKGADGTEIIFWCFAIFGTVFFILRVLLMVLGGFGAEDLDSGDVDVDGDMHAGHEVEAHHSDRLTGSDTAFKLFSLHSITGFFMMLGWVGLACYKQFDLSITISAITAITAGVITMYVTAMFYKVMLGLASPGATFNIGDIVDKDVTVYLKIPGEGVGKVQFSDKGVSRIVEAVSEEKIDIDSFQTVRVVKVVSPRRVSVKADAKGKAKEKS
jgi:hypothetical protein